MSPGQVIQVAAPDGSGRMVMATVPPGMPAGSTFTVEFPPNGISSPAPAVVSSTFVSPPQQEAMSPIIDYSKVQVMAPPAQEPFAQAVPIGSAPGATTISASPHELPSPMPAPFGQPQLRVQVPPGTAPGTTVHVPVPGENRTIIAQVPHGGVTSFQVPYEPQRVDSAPFVHRQQSVGEKLILVRVPPGTAPGTTLHVSIPDEPGRLIAAKVPPGNVSEFHVSYQPAQQQQQRNGFQQQPRTGNGFQQRNPNNRQNNGGGMGGMILPALGGAALGMAGMSMYDHYHHANNDSNAYGDYGGGNDYGGGDYGGGDDYGGDYGGGDDFGGVEDYGGGDFGDFGDFGGDF